MKILLRQQLIRGTMGFKLDVEEREDSRGLIGREKVDGSAKTRSHYSG